MFNKYLPEDSAKGKYLTLVGEYSGISISALYAKYCFRRAVCGDYQIQDFINAGFCENELLVQIGWLQQDCCTPTGTYHLSSNWKTDVDAYASKVLGFWMDEPSIALDPSTLQNVKNYIALNGSKLWLEDYDTGPVPPNILYGWPTAYHPANYGMLQQDGDYIWNNGNTSAWVSGANVYGVDVLSTDYSLFEQAFGSKFNGIECQPMDGSGALMNDATMCKWLISNLNASNFCYAIGTGNAKISDGDLNARLAGLNNFMNDAAGAGFLGTENQLYNYLYVCQENGVLFTPPGPSGSYYGVWNGSGYTGPVDPNGQGAVLCWLLVSTTPTGQFQDIY